MSSSRRLRRTSPDHHRQAPLPPSRLGSLSQKEFTLIRLYRLHCEKQAWRQRHLQNHPTEPYLTRTATVEMVRQEVDERGLMGIQEPEVFARRVNRTAVP
jgi:hypothetical protein